MVPPGQDASLMILLEKEAIMCKPVLGALALVLALVLVIACTPSRWQRPDTDAGVLDADVRQCEREANAYARQLAPPGSTTRRSSFSTRRGQ
jgi:hypothetical protein